MKFYVISSLLIIFFMKIDNGTGIIMNGGTRVTGNEFNYVALIRIDNKPTCGGAIIDVWHILTAAHCVDNSTETQITVLAGSKCLYSRCGSVHNVRKKHYPASFEVFTEEFRTSDGQLQSIEYSKDDIAVLTLQIPLTLGPDIAKISLPSRDVSFPAQSLCKIAGWGQTNINSAAMSNNLLWTHSSLIEPRVCRATHPKLPSKIICSRHPNGTATILNGDSGSPLACQGVVVGVISISSLANTLIIFPNVYEYLSFINDAIRENTVFKNAYVSPPKPRNQQSCVCM